MKLKTLLVGGVLAATVAVPAMLSAAMAESLYIPLLTYRTGAFAGSGIPIADGLHDYFTMLNERDGGIGGVKLEIEECETGYSAEKGVECYEGTKAKGALVYNPYSTGITLQLIPKAAVDKIPVLSMGYGLSAAAVGDKFPWIFNVPATYWSQASAIVGYIAGQEGGLEALKGKKIGFIYLDVGYGKEPIPLLEQFKDKYGFELFLYPVPGKEMQNQSSLWLNVQRDAPDYMIMWGWGAMNPTAVKEAVNTGFDMSKFIGVWWSGGNLELAPSGDAAKGYKSANFHGTGTDYPAIQDIKKYVIDAGKSQAKDASALEENYYLRGMTNAVIVAEAIRTAQEKTGKKAITGEDMRIGLENLDLTEARLAEIGLKDFTIPMKVSCQFHDGGSNPIYLQEWDGSGWKRIAQIEPMYDVVRPMLEMAAEDYLKDKADWQTQTCN
jgi:branched-chain amino acid transport system substrate-binding protein